MIPLISHEAVTREDQIAEVTTYQGSLSLCIHAMGFLELSSIAARATLENKAAIDAITPSIIYGIRHATELFLKHIIEEISEKHRLVAQVPNKKGVITAARTDHHWVEQLWREHRSTIVEVLEYEADLGEHANFDRRAWLAEFDEIINQVHRVDPDGQSLRYPADKSGAPNLGGKMMVSVAQLEQFACHATECFIRFTERGC
jgi:hypothetical protein